MEHLWQRLEAWLQRYAPDVFDTLNPGASEEVIHSAEATMSVTFPKEVKDFYRIHNGQETDKYGWTATKLFHGWETPHLNRVAQQWAMWKQVLDQGSFDGVHSDPDKGVRDDWWNVKWVPLTQNSSGDHLCLDLAPAEGGTVGQIISVWHDAPERTVEARSFLAWVEDFADGLEEGRFIYSKGYGGICPANEARDYE